jgi:hypothetical protein
LPQGAVQQKGQENAMKKNTKSVKIPVDLHRTLRQEAARRGEKMQEVVESAIRKGLAK